MSQNAQYNSVLDEARAAIKEHNSRLVSSTEGGIALPSVATIDADEFVRNLQGKLGGTDLDALREASWEDLESLGLPKLLARKVARIFRAEPVVVDTPAPVTASPVAGLDKLAEAIRTPASMTTAELIDRYDPDEATSPVAEELKRRFGSKKVLVFDVNGKFDTGATKEVVRLLSDGLPQEDYYVYPNGGAEVDVFEVGRKPGQVFELSPIHKEPMRNGVCPVDRQAWGKLDLRVRQLVSIIADLGLIGDKREAAVALFKVAEGGFASLEALYGDAAREFRKLEQEDKLPVLKRRAGDTGTAAPKGSNPFGVAVGHRNR